MTITHRWDRWMYRGGRPHGTARWLNRLWGRLAGAGLGPDRLVRMEVVGRRSGRTVAFPVVVTRHEGQRYLVSMLGAGSNWVANVRAAGGEVVLQHGGREAVHLDEVDVSRRAPILRRYLEDAPGARAHLGVRPGAAVAEFERVAADHPVFRVGPPRRPGGVTDGAAPA